LELCSDFLDNQVATLHCDGRASIFIRRIRGPGVGGTTVAKSDSMSLNQKFPRPRTEQNGMTFWQRLVGEQELQQCTSLEKLLVGCEIIAALDGVDLLAA
jgi:hypothetical protein